MDRYVRCEVKGGIGEGTYGVVYKGHDKLTNSSVALKRIRLETEDEGIPCTTLREIAVLRQLKHPNIVELTDVVQENNRLYLVFEFVDCDLKKYMDGLGNELLEPDLVKNLSYQLVNGIHYCHNKGIMHRDLKPQNLLVSMNGQLKIADFGLARAFIPPLRPFTHEVVTLWYRAPEILLGEKVYALPVDIWAIGAILIEMSTKHPLFPGNSEIDELFKIFRVRGTPNTNLWPEALGLCDFNDQFPQWPTLDISKFAPHLSREGIDLIEGMLCLSPADRLSASECLNHPYFEGCAIKQDASNKVEMASVPINLTPEAKNQNQRQKKRVRA